MTTHFCISVRFLQPMYHGRRDGGEPEWPPSPLRLFQAVVEASASRWNERLRLESAAPALRWLERQPAPTIIAAVGERSLVKHRLYVPDNVCDLVARSWSRGGTESIANYRTEKDVCPTHLRQGDAVHFLWRLPDDIPDIEGYKEILTCAARSITHLGWGIDMVAADASVLSEADANGLPGESWRPTDDGAAIDSRVPVEGTLDALIVRHGAFLHRLGLEDFNPVPPLSTFGLIGYRRATDRQRRVSAAFSLLKSDATGFRPFDAPRMGIAVAAMMRHASSNPERCRSLGWPPEKVARFVLGHGESLGEPHAPVAGPRLAYIPLPSIEPRGPGRAEVVGSIRRALISVFGGQANVELRQLARLLSGGDLIEEGRGHAVALLARIPDSDRMVLRYTKSATTWATVTPIILPGYDDPRKLRKRLFSKSEAHPSEADEQRTLLEKLEKRVDYLIRKAILQAGYPADLAQNARIESRGVGFWPGTEPATRYVIPDKLRRFRRLHVRIKWHDPSGSPIQVSGPVCLGGGRFLGLGLFAAVD